jgi:peptidoglycan/LPS O-acetylase OafA/YrhL
MTADHATEPARRRPHLHAVDLVRVLTVALVVGVHTVTHVVSPLTVAAGALVAVLHTSREVFFVLTALVLVHGYGRSRVRWLRFWRRRYPVVVVPYIVWTLVYYVADGHWVEPLSASARLLGGDLLTGGARYQMYFLLVTMQIYLCFPVLRWLLRVTERRHGLLLGACALFQVAFALGVHEGWAPGGVLTAWLRGPDAVLPSYLLYVVAGGVAAWHLEAVTAWTRRHRRHILAGAATAIAVTLAVYLAQAAGGMAPVTASAVFQPMLVLESLAVAWAFFAAGLAWTERGAPCRRLVLAASDASFAIYLGHPLLLQGVMAVATTGGLVAAAGRAPGAVVLLAVAALVPLLYAVTGAVAALVRRTPVSLPLTGRPRLRRSSADAAVPVPTPPSARTSGAAAPSPRGTSGVVAGAA